MPIFNYPAIRVKQSPDGQYVVLFGAPAVEIDEWGGVPQKKQLGEGDGETTGFQREENPKRLESLREFYSDSNNTVQNPLLVAPRTRPGENVEFQVEKSSSDGQTDSGTIRISVDDFAEHSLLKLLEFLKESLEQRVPALKEHPLPEALVENLKRKAGEAGHNLPDSEEDGPEGTESSEEPSEGEYVPESALFSEESHILEFYEEISARIQVLKQIPNFAEDTFFGFSREAVISFLKPVIIVDGQHRLRGALLQCKAALEHEPLSSRALNEIQAGGNPEDVEKTLLGEISRRLPVSMLMNPDPGEHVFQFVIVNQKATPIGRALLGTIVATTLSTEELTRVSDRLSKAGILLEEARHVAFLSRDPSSPFCGFVETGLRSTGNATLPFTVMVALVTLFRELKGGKLWHDPNDYADIWRRDFLPISGIVSEWENKGFKSPEDFWRSDTGPWRKVFIEFWKSVKETLASDDSDAHNCWGNTRNSNIFNKIYLHILASDFFQFLVDKELAINIIDDIKELVTDEWLGEVKSSYFARDWKMEGQKKDVPGIRKQWSTLWVNYRKSRGGKAPSVGEFKKAAS